MYVQKKMQKTTQFYISMYSSKPLLHKLDVTQGQSLRVVHLV